MTQPDPADDCRGEAVACREKFETTILPERIFLENQASVVTSHKESTASTDEEKVLVEYVPEALKLVEDGMSGVSVAGSVDKDETDANDEKSMSAVLRRFTERSSVVLVISDDDSNQRVGEDTTIAATRINRVFSNDNDTCIIVPGNTDDYSKKYAAVVHSLRNSHLECPAASFISLHASSFVHLYLTFTQDGYSPIVYGTREDGLCAYGDLGSVLDRAWKWNEEYRNRITTEHRSCKRALIEAFTRFHEHGFLFRVRSLSIWSYALISVFWGIEVESLKFEDRTYLPILAHPVNPNDTQCRYEFEVLTHSGYPMVKSDERVEVATTILENMLGNTVVAIYPDDKRFERMHCKYVLYSIQEGRRTPINADAKLFNPTFGTVFSTTTLVMAPHPKKIDDVHVVTLVQSRTKRLQLMKIYGSWRGSTGM